jgi:Flp pilus assembly pilin Flp
MSKLNEMILGLYVRTQNWIQDEDGQGMSEYALLVVLVAIFLIGGIVLLRGELQTIINQIVGGLRGPNVRQTW